MPVYTLSPLSYFGSGLLEVIDLFPCGIVVHEYVV